MSCPGLGENSYPVSAPREPQPIGQAGWTPSADGCSDGHRQRMLWKQRKWHPDQLGGRENFSAES